MAPRKKKVVNKPVEITVLTQTVQIGQRRLRHLLTADGEMRNLNGGGTAFAEQQVDELEAERKRVKEINQYVDGRTLVEMRLRGGPMATLINGNKIGGEEFRAIMDIELAFTAMSGAGLIKPVSLELKSAGVKPEWSTKTNDAVQRYVPFANFWSGRKTFGDRTYEIVTSAVIFNRAFRVIEEEVGIRHGMASRIAVRGLRDYAARAKWVAHGLAAKWMDEAMLSYRGHDPLSLAISRAAALRQAEKEGVS